jgi:hypothetical protein
MDPLWIPDQGLRSSLLALVAAVVVDYQTSQELPGPRGALS